MRCIQAEAQAPGAGLTQAWIRLERLKGPVEGADSLWLELEWHRAHALLLAGSGSAGPLLGQTLMAWGEVMTRGRGMKFPAVVLEACTRSSRLLWQLGEKLGARARIQDALPSFQELGARLPEAAAESFRGRNDIDEYLAAAQTAGLPIAWPERAAPETWGEVVWNGRFPGPQESYILPVEARGPLNQWRPAADPGGEPHQPS